MLQRFASVVKAPRSIGSTPIRLLHRGVLPLRPINNGVSTRMCVSASSSNSTRTVNSRTSMWFGSLLARSMSTVNITVPPLGESVTDATLKVLLKKVGDPVNVDEPVSVLETDKVSVDVRSHIAGSIASLPVPLDATVKVGDTIMTVKPGPGGSAASAKPVAPATAAPTAAAPKPAVAAASSHTEPPARQPKIQFRYGKANAAAAPRSPSSAGSSGAPKSAPIAGAGSTTGSKTIYTPKEVFTNSSFELNFTGPDPFTPTPPQYARAPLSDAVMRLIELGGAVDPPAPAKAAKGGAKGGAPAMSGPKKK